jgi:hypothetical protein
MPASTLRTYRDGRLARGCGLVTVRQRPGTAKGVLFVTLEGFLAGALSDDRVVARSLGEISAKARMSARGRKYELANAASGRAAARSR